MCSFALHINGRGSNNNNHHNNTNKLPALHQPAIQQRTTNSNSNSCRSNMCIQIMIAHCILHEFDSRNTKSNSFTCIMFSIHKSRHVTAPHRTDPHLDPATLPFLIFTHSPIGCGHVRSKHCACVSRIRNGNWTLVFLKVYLFCFFTLSCCVFFFPILWFVVIVASSRFKL